MKLPPEIPMLLDAANTFWMNLFVEQAGPHKKPSVDQMELRLVQSKADIENPEITVRACALSWRSLGID